MSPDKVLDFWFEEIDPSLWFNKDELFDQQVTKRFERTYENIVEGKSENWRSSPRGRLAEIIVLDQFSRNMFRNSAKAFAADFLALSLAKEAIENGDDQKLNITERGFLYMPFMHSEDIKDHETAMKLFAQKGLENNLKFEILHKKIIERFGRYPHRNKILGRESTAEEITFLTEPNSSF